MHNKTFSFLFVLTIYLLPSKVTPQEACSLLLQQGVYDQYSMSTGSSSYNGFVSNFCSNYNAYNQAKSSSGSEDSDSVSLGGSFDDFGINFGFGSGQANNLSSDQISALGSLLCNSGSNVNAAQNAASEAASFIDPSAMQAYEECLTQYAAGLQVTTTIRQIDQAQVTIEIKYVAPTGAPPQTELTGINISPLDSWTCHGPLIELLSNTSDHLIGTEAAAMSCTRNVAWEPFMYQNQPLYARASTITIMLTSGTVTRSFVPIYVKPSVQISQISTFPTNTIASAIQAALSREMTAEVALYQNVCDLTEILLMVMELSPVLTGYCSSAQESQVALKCAALPDYSDTLDPLDYSAKILQSDLDTTTSLNSYISSLF